MNRCDKGGWASGNHKNLGFPERIKRENALEEVLLAGVEKVKLLGLNSARSGMNWGGKRRSLPPRAGMVFSGIRGDGSG